MSQEIKDEKVEVKTYSQEEFDNAIASAKKRVEAKFEKAYVSKEEYDNLSAKYTELEHSAKQPYIKDAFEKLGGRKEAFNDFIKLNPNLYDTEIKDLESVIGETSKNSPYMFNKSFQATVSESAERSKPKANNTSF